MWAVVVLFAVMTVIFICGKGGALIAGYNTATPYQKAKYNVKRLNKVMAFCMGSITLITGVIIGTMGRMPHWFVGVMVIVMFVCIAITLVLMNTYCKNTPEEMEELGEIVPETDEEKLRNKKTVRFSLIFTIAAIVIVGIFLCTGKIEITAEEESIAIHASYWPDLEINYADITSVEYDDNFNKGSRDNGYGSLTMGMGDFSNFHDRFTLYAYFQVDGCVIVHTDREMYVFNVKTEEATKKLYEDIRERMDENIK